MKKTHIILLSIVAVLLIIRIALPSILKTQINKQLATLPEYRGHIDDLDLVLYKGGIAFDEFRLEKIGLEDTIPFIHLERAELTIDLRALFKGYILAELDLYKPKVNFVAAEDTSKQQFGGDYLWFESLVELQPIEINRLGIKDGEIHFKKVDTEPKIDLCVSKLNATARNLRNVVDDEELLPSHFSATALVFDEGEFELDADMNILKEVPDLNLNFVLNRVNVTELNNFLITYSNMDASSGQLDVYSEVVVTDKKIEGYIKPLMTNLHFSEKDQDQKLKTKILEGISDFVVSIIKNQSEDQVATKVPLKGTVDDSKIGVWKTILNVLKNGFIEAFKRKLDHTVEFPADEK